MRVVEVIPLRRGIQKETLSYFTKEDFPLGSFVKIPLRNKEIFGIVTRTSDALSEKTNLKRARFELKKLTRVETEGNLPEAFMKAARATAYYYATTVGSMLGALLPTFVLETPELFTSTQSGQFEAHEPLVLQQPQDERMREYKSIIRECFARNQSVLFVVPTHEDALRAEAELSTGIEEYVFTTSRSTKKKVREQIIKARTETHPIVFITTPIFLFFDRADLSTIIVERENSRAYRTLRRPYFHYKIFIEAYAKFAHKILVFGDNLLSLETLEKMRDNKYIERSPLTWRTTFKAPLRIVDMRRKNALPSEDIAFRVFSKHLSALIDKAVEEKKKIFLFGVRKGIAPSTVCGHCGALLLCKNCGAPTVLHKLEQQGNTTSADRIYICHHCGDRRDPLTLCDNCGSWKLVPLGIGTDRIAEEVERLYPKTPLFVLDKEHAPDRRKAIEIAKNFASVKGGIMVGTELAFLYLDRLSYSAVVSLDSLFSIPDFSINERIYYFLDHLHAMTEGEMIVQTRNPSESTFEFAREGDTLGFFRKEINERKELSYPPFALFVKVSFTGSPEQTRAKAVELQHLFGEYSPNFMEKKQSHTERTLTMIIRVSRDLWPEAKIIGKLTLLSPDFLVKVDPDSIL